MIFHRAVRAGSGSPACPRGALAGDGVRHGRRVIAGRSGLKRAWASRVRQCKVKGLFRGGPWKEAVQHGGCDSAVGSSEC